MKNWIVTVALSVLSISGFAQTQEQIDAYVQSHKNIAIAEMYRSGIPASITLAQGILETAAGTSPLYLRSNNNFGIKCKSNWNGKFTYHDDDAKGECFRVYDNDSASYVDHSNFLKTASRYSFLFELDKTDYKGWAIGLRKAGYATNPSYASILIKHIEENNLQQYDNVNSITSHTMVNGVAVSKKITSSQTTSYEHANDKQNSVVETAPSANLPSADAKEENDYPTVHWQVSNVSDATNSYTVTPVAGNRHPVYSSKTKSRYTKAKLHNISYGSTTAKGKKTNAKQNGAIAHKAVSVKHSATIAQSAKRKTNKGIAAKGGKKQA